jgi:RsiW-degrading membrane proteinase PrsW (M82 family)
MSLSLLRLDSSLRRVCGPTSSLKSSARVSALVQEAPPHSHPGWRAPCSRRSHRVGNLPWQRPVRSPDPYAAPPTPPLPDEVRRAAAVPDPASRRDSQLAAGLAFGLVMGLVAVLLLAIIGRSVGAGGLVVGVLLAFVPVLPVLSTFLWVDRYEPEPRGYIVFSLVWGASVAALLALLVNKASITLLSASGGREVAAVWVAPWFEEAAKGAAVVLVLLLRRREFDGVVDGIVMAGLSGLGFAFMENILYFGRAFTTGKADHGPIGGIFLVGVVFTLRAVFAPFAHPMFTAAFGVGLGLAAQAARPWQRVVAPALGFLTAVVLHAAWNLSVVSGLRGFVTAYIVVMVPVFLAFVGLVLWARRREQGIIARQLPAYAAAGWLTAGEVPTLASLAARQRMRLLAGRTGGRRAATAAKAYQHVATELAFLRHRASRGMAGVEFPEHERDLLLALEHHRAVLGGMAPELSRASYHRPRTRR